MRLTSSPCAPAPTFLLDTERAMLRENVEIVEPHRSGLASSTVLLRLLGRPPSRYRCPS
jgi:hypothetical protein